VGEEGRERKTKKEKKQLCRLSSYVSGLHPVRQRAFYGVVEELVAAAIPLWEKCLSWQTDERRIKISTASRPIKGLRTWVRK